MIKTFTHKGLELFFNTGKKTGIQPAHAEKLGKQLAVLNVATKASDMGIPGWNLHSLSGKLAGHWAVKVNGNWRMTFKFVGTDVELVDYQDYH